MGFVHKPADHLRLSPPTPSTMACTTVSMIAAAPAVVAPVANTTAARNMMTWNPIGNTMYETFSFLPPLSDMEIAKQVDYIIGNSWTPCLEVSPAETSSTGDVFGCTNASEVLREIQAAKMAFPNCYIRVCAFDSERQVQVASFLVQRISTALPIDRRSVM